MRTFQFNILGDPITRKGVAEAQGWLTAIQRECGTFGHETVVGLGFEWVTNKKGLNRLVIPTRRHLINALRAAGILSPLCVPKRLYNLEQRVRPAYGGDPIGTVTVKEE